MKTFLVSYIFYICRGRRVCFCRGKQRRWYYTDVMYFSNPSLFLPSGAFIPCSTQPLNVGSCCIEGKCGNVPYIERQSGSLIFTKPLCVHNVSGLALSAHRCPAPSRCRRATYSPCFAKRLHTSAQQAVGTNYETERIHPEAWRTL